MRTLSRTPIAEIRERTYKARDAWWTVLLVDPVAVHLVRWWAPYRWITPNLLSIVALLIGFGAAACFATADRTWLVVGAVLFHISFVVDCVDGKIARLNGTGSLFGAWLDYMLDRVRVVVCAVALFGGQHHVTGNDWYLIVGGAVVFLDTVHHVNSLEISRVKATMRRQLWSARNRLITAEQIIAEHTGPVAADDSPVEPAAIVIRDPKPDFRASFKPYRFIRDNLVAGRIRPNVVSTVELHMAVFIVGPLTGAILPVAVVTGALLILFEIAISLNLWLNTRAHSRKLATALRKAEQAEAEAATLTGDAPDQMAGPDEADEPGPGDEPGPEDETGQPDDDQPAYRRLSPLS